MSRRRTRLVLLASVVCLLLAAVPGTSAFAAGRAHRPRITTALETRQIVQQALLIGISSNVLQSQFQLDFYLSPGAVGHCQALDGGGSDEVQSARTTGRVTKGVNVLYYDAKCARRYMVQSATYVAGTGNDPVNRLTATNTYYGLKGRKLGVMNTKETAQSRGESTELLNGLGTFRVVGVRTPVSLGLGCALDEGQTGVDGRCQGGVAQDFAAQHYSLGSVVPVDFVAKSGGLTFTSKSATRRAGARHALSIIKGKPQQLILKGAGAGTGSTSMSGHAGSFSLFPPAPTGWTVTDRRHHLSVTLTVTKGAVRDVTGTVKSTTTHHTLATIRLDRSGTGRLRYRTKSVAPITSWILTK